MSSNEIVCPVDKAINLLNKKWSVQIIRDMFFGKKHFKQFQEDKPNLSNKVLSNCLKNLEKNGLIKKKVLNTTPVTTEYLLTDYGKSLNKVIYELAMFTLNKYENNNYDLKTREDLKKTFRKTLEITD